MLGHMLIYADIHSIFYITTNITQTFSFELILLDYRIDTFTPCIACIIYIKQLSLKEAQIKPKSSQT